MTDASTTATNGKTASQPIQAPSVDEVGYARDVIRREMAARRASAKPKALKSFQALGATTKVDGAGWRVSERATDWDNLRPNEPFSLTSDGLALCVKVSARKFTDLRRGKGESAIPVECYRVYF